MTFLCIFLGYLFISDRLGESYVDGWWDCENLDNFIYKLLISQDMMKMQTKNIKFLTWAFLARFNSISMSNINTKEHYNLGNDLYKKMLDKRMVYTCAYWDSDAKNLDEAQEHKLEMVCQKLMLKPGMRVLDVGCGFGSFAKYAAEKYGVNVTGITISEEQSALARELCKGLPVEILIKDYREIVGSFDRIVSIGMMEHIGLKNQRIYFEKMKSLLKQDGIFLVHTIGSNHSHFSSPWLEKYIFPGCHSPSIKHIGLATEDLFFIEDWHNIGHNYYKTLIEARIIIKYSQKYE
jgi:cyclopropane-fatty-acyl-phospholipid synthase